MIAEAFGGMGLTTELRGAAMINAPLRLTAFFATVGGLLNAGYHFQTGNQFAALFFLGAVTALTIVCEIAVRTKRI